MAKTPESLHNADAFTKSVADALKHYGDPTWLGSHSSLAAPYFLGSQLKNTTESDQSRGQVLQRVMADVAATLTPKQQIFLDKAFFHRPSGAYSANIDVAAELDRGASSYYRHRAETVEAFAKALSRTVVPSLRPEMPRHKTMVGRQAIFSTSLEALQSSQTVILTGDTGMGKTALGRAVVEKWGTSRTFWFTIREQINDRITSLVFALSYFLQGMGATATWRQLVATHGRSATNLSKEDIGELLALIRHDLSDVRQINPLICIDECNVLNRRVAEHAVLLDFVDALRRFDHAPPFLLIGQQVPISLDQRDQQHLVVDFTIEESAEFLVSVGLDTLSELEQHSLIQVTQGNPTLLSLIAAVHIAGEPVAQFLNKPSNGTAVSAESLLRLIWSRLLSEHERDVLMELAIYRTIVPSDAWDAESATLQDLAARDLVQTVEQIGFTLPHAIQGFVRRQIPDELLAKLHSRAAYIYESRGEITSAAFHYAEAREYHLAIYLWHHYRFEEQEHGHVAEAYSFFKNINSLELDREEDHRMLADILAFQTEMLGLHREMDAALSKVHYPQDHPLRPRWLEQRGRAQELQGNRNEAEVLYLEALHTFDYLPQSAKIHLHDRLGDLYLIRALHDDDLDKAWLHAQTARFDTENLAGSIEEQKGNFTAAAACFQIALGLADQVRDPTSARARTLSNLGRLSWKTGDGEKAIRYSTEASQIFQAQGDMRRVAIEYTSLSAAYIINQNYSQARDAALTGLEAATAISDSYSIAINASNAGEACFYLGLLDEAERYAQMSVDQESEETSKPYALTVLGMTYRVWRRLEAAESSLKLAVDSATMLHDPLGEAPAWRTLGNLYADHGRYPEASQAFMKAIDLYLKLGLPEFVAAIQLEMNNQLGETPAGLTST